MASKKRKYREKISETSGGVLDLFDHPSFRTSLPAQDVVRPRDDSAKAGSSTPPLDDDELDDAPSAEPRPA